MATYLPGTACVFTAPGCVVGSEFRVVWIGLTAPDNASSSAVFWGSNASTGGAKVLRSMIAGACVTVPMDGPFNLNACGMYVGQISSGSAIVWMR